MARLIKNSDTDFFIQLDKKEDYKRQYPLTNDLHLHSYIDRETGNRETVITFMVDRIKYHSLTIPRHTKIDEIKRMIDEMYTEIMRQGRLF
jgi:hypothetical protein